jgi:hypothetical protein
MEIDFPKVALFVLAVLPGYFALRARKSIAPLSLHKKGATEELAGFFVYSALVHFILALVFICLWALAGLLLHQHPLFYLRPSLLSPAPALAQKAIHLPASLILLYVPLSFATGWAIGFGRGLFSVWRPLTVIAERLGFTKQSRAGKLWSRRVGRFLLTSRPIIYDALFPEEDETGQSKLVFVELALKDGGGKYIGQVKAFSITRDEEEHKLLYMIDVYRQSSLDESFEKLDVEGMLFDLSEAATLGVLQTQG